MKRFAARLQHVLRIVRARPRLAAVIVVVWISSWRRVYRFKARKVLVGTHHKVLTVYMDRVFDSFAQISNRSISVGMASQVDYGADIIFDHHSQFDFERIDFEYDGLHIRRDPRDVVISSGFYHKDSSERWLHVPREWLGGKTYQQYINAMSSMEDVFLHELEQTAGSTIRDMLAWDYNRGFVELKYEELVVPEGGKRFRQGIDRWALTTPEKTLLEGLFDYYSVFDGRGEDDGHVRDASSRQFQHYFTERLQKGFSARFPGAPERLGYR